MKTHPVPDDHPIHSILRVIIDDPDHLISTRKFDYTTHLPVYPLSAKITKEGLYIVLVSDKRSKPNHHISILAKETYEPIPDDCIFIDTIIIPQKRKIDVVRHLWLKIHG